MRILKIYKLLLVDDEPIILQGMKAFLSSNSSFILDIKTAANGYEALEILDAEKIQLMVSDIKMPKMSGIVLMEKVIEKNPEIKIILLTGYGEFDDIYTSSKYTNVKYLLKIESEDEILNQVDRMLMEIEATEPFFTNSTTVIEGIHDFINDNLSSDISLNTIAEHMHFNPSYLSRYYKAVTSGNLSDYINKVRIEKAKKYLAKNRYTISEIADMLGFSSSSYFIIFFKKHTGITPKKFIN